MNCGCGLDLVAGDQPSQAAELAGFLIPSPKLNAPYGSKYVVLSQSYIYIHTFT